MENKIRYMLISVFDREILTEMFPTLEAAQETMHMEMISEGGVPEEFFVGDSREDKDKGYAYGPYDAYSNDGINHADCDWHIAPIDPFQGDD